jgi:outer membrane protein TolC
VNLSNLLQRGSANPSADAAIRLPIFEGGRLRGALAARNSDYDVAVEQYNQALSDALREVVDQLSSMHSVQAQRAEANAALASAEEAYQLAVTRYQAGIGSLLQVLTAETAVLEQRALHSELGARELAISINLVRALGGGFDLQVATR